MVPYTQSLRATSRRKFGLCRREGTGRIRANRGARSGGRIGFVERLWRSIKYDEVYLCVYDTVADARASIGRYLDFYNGRRTHSSLDRDTPDAAYFDALTPIPAAA